MFLYREMSELANLRKMIFKFTRQNPKANYRIIKVDLTQQSLAVPFDVEGNTLVVIGQPPGCDLQIGLNSSEEPALNLGRNAVLRVGYAINKVFVTHYPPDPVTYEELYQGQQWVYVIVGWELYYQDSGSTLQPATLTDIDLIDMPLANTEYTIVRVPGLKQFMIKLRDAAAPFRLAIVTGELVLPAGKWLTFPAGAIVTADMLHYGGTLYIASSVAAQKCERWIWA